MLFKNILWCLGYHSCHVVCVVPFLCVFLWSLLLSCSCLDLLMPAVILVLSLTAPIVCLLYFSNPVFSFTVSLLSFPGGHSQVTSKKGILESCVSKSIYSKFALDWWLRKLKNSKVSISSLTKWMAFPRCSCPSLPCTISFLWIWILAMDLYVKLAPPWPYLLTCMFEIFYPIVSILSFCHSSSIYLLYFETSDLLMTSLLPCLLLKISALKKIIYYHF